MFKKKSLNQFFAITFLILIIVSSIYAKDAILKQSALGSIDAVLQQSASAPIKERPKYIFYFIGDGLGAAQRQSADYFLQQYEGKKLLMNTFPVSGINTTHSGNTLVTDSAAAGTALATGHKTNNGIISQLPDGTNLKTLVEVAEEKGMGTGIVTTTRLTHATPAVFASHNPSRSNESEIANDYVSSNVDFFAGGGIRHFIPKDYATEEDASGKSISSNRKDDRNLFKEFESKGYKTFLGKKGAKDFSSYSPKGKEQVFAAFTNDHLPYEIDRLNSSFKDSVPTLGNITQKGIDVLSKYENGFFMVIEGGRIDHACHANDAVGSIHDTIALDEAISKAYEFMKKHPKETLIVVSGDHETGGMGLGFDTNYFMQLDKLRDVKFSVGDTLMNTYDGDRAKYFNYIAKNYALSDITPEEKSKIENAMNIVDKNPKAVWGGSYSPVAISTTHVISNRAQIGWTTYAHSGTQIPLSVIGVGSSHFGGFKDNTEIAKIMFSLLGK
ncbi:alkaline phosphatase [Gottschalkia acidurici 9a]|uniref:Alkaline phosphatase n=1 Tax=Gottschalkia acidurici (strain ATCC 7906 / DSM 604 / BCRC 14475 / CIP 104303 / KCTC 5404 / NCIMB 10678 / 9a) TaxID=1128398 RepID=K0B376_GOTA9|nr:alkaline phosphatase [Gottschalkia acidurici]AFS79091.1 alkaline phosphatase [Gottschalkia acidurici 9a]